MGPLLPSSLQPQLPSSNKKPHHASTLMRPRLNSITKSTSSPRPSMSDTGPTLSTLLVPLRTRAVVHQNSKSTPGNSSIRPSPSQELEDTHTFKRTWTCSSISRIILTPTLATQSTWPTSSRLQTPSRRTSTPNTTTVNSLIQPSMPTRQTEHDCRVSELWLQQL